MGRAQGRSNLRQSIAEILGTAEPAVSVGTRPGPLRRSLIYSSMALLAVNPAQVGAVGLGEMNVSSYLDQPLNATVPIVLAAGESLPKNCVAPTRGKNTIGTPKNIRVSTPAATKAGTYSLRVTTTNALHEPMYEISLLIDCPGTPLLVRQYVLMLDMPGVQPSGIDTSVPTANQGDSLMVPAASLQTSAQSTDQTMISTTSQNAARSLRKSRAAIPAGKAYRVRSGDTLSTIAARIEGRAPDTTWSVANLLFATNPQAFIRNNPDLIKLGSLINIPGAAELTGLETGRVSVTSAAVAAPWPAQPETISEPLPVPAPIPTPVAAPAATNRPEVFVTEPERPDSTTFVDEFETSVTVSEEAPEPFVAQPPATSAPDEGKTDVITPFLDEQPAPAVVATVATTIDSATTAPKSIPVVTTTPRSEPADPINPWITALFGMLLGLMISFVMFRRHLSDAVLGLVRRKTSASTWPERIKTHAQPPIADDEDPIAATKNAFDAAEADSAFETSQDDSGPLPIGDPAESAYIVETGVAANTAEGKAPDFDPGTLENFGESQQDSDGEMLAQLFDQDDGSASDMFDPTGGIADDITGNEADIFSEPTAEMPRPADDPLFDPTQDLPTDFDGDMFDPTVEMPAGMANELSGDTVDVPVDVDELFAAGNDLLQDYVDDLPTAEMQDDPTIESELIESELDELPDDDESVMARTLHEAMTLLERDFEDEFTASQIIETSEIKRSFDKEQAKEAEDLDLPEQEVSD